ncbi:hypothetical protein GT030_07990 [Streptomyces sp. SID1328]|uniref:hypothetical protein n=1 Tax=Streptomyces sp. SID1328 TaxID=2690250 RepID=UPI00136B9DFA|nr:hypothetical protein [Streptomyces sp. SID1328]MYV38812.1 hypothetical protein [Streptomyces sp. SID1328]
MLLRLTRTCVPPAKLKGLEMPLRPITRRLVLALPPTVGGAGGLLAVWQAGAPMWLSFLLLVTGVVSTAVGVLPALFPQESAHRRDVWRAFGHRERMRELRIGATERAEERRAQRSRSGLAPDRQYLPTQPDGRSHSPGEHDLALLQRARRSARVRDFLDAFGLEHARS